jgi:hypothetical protein
MLRIGAEITNRDLPKMYGGASFFSILSIPAAGLSIVSMPDQIGLLNLQARDRSITDQPLADGIEFCKMTERAIVRRRISVVDVIHDFLFRTRLSDDENLRNSVFVRENVSSQIFSFAFSLIVVHNFLTDSSISAID